MEQVLSQLSQTLNENVTASSAADVMFVKKTLELPPSPIEFIGVLVLMLITFLANAGGLGGGGVLIPFMLLFLNLSIYESVPLANVFGLIASFTRFVVNFNQKHPNKQKAQMGKVAIDYEIVQLTMPLLYLGTLFGVYIGTYLSGVVVAVSLGVTLLFMCYTTVQKAMKNYKEENVKRMQDSQKATEMRDLLQGGSQPHSNESPLNRPVIISQELAQIYEEESKHFPMRRVVNFVITLVLLFATSMMLGSKYQKEKIVDPIWAYLMLAVFITYSIASTIINAQKIRKVHAIKKRDGYIFDPKDMHFDDNKSIAKVVVFCFIAGILGGIVGIAGGIILGPLFLAMGMLPVVVSGTNQYLALISTISVSGQFLYIGILNIPYALAIGLLQVLASYFGVTQANRIVKLTGRQSYISFILAFVLFISFISLPLKYILL